MERIDVIDLGEASVETKGPAGPINDTKLGQFVPGLSDDCGCGGARPAILAARRFRHAR